MLAFFEAIRKEGISEADIERMAQTNPRRRWRREDCASK